MLRYPVVHDFSNVGFSSPARSFAGFPKALHGLTKDIVPREALRLDLKAGDLLSISGAEGSVSVRIAAFDARGKDALNLLDLEAEGPLDKALANCAELNAWIASQGGDEAAEIPVAGIPGASLPIVLSASARVTLWIISVLSCVDLISGAAKANTVRLTHQPKDTSGPVLPPELGDVREEFTVKRGTGIAYEVRRGEFIQVIDVEGQPVSYTHLTLPTILRV